MPKNKYGTKRGWFKESRRHSLAAKGVKTRSNERYIARDSNTFNQAKFNRMSKAQQRGTIIDLAKKSFAGMAHAVQWEAKHLPAQAQWVKDEFREAKSAVSKTYKTLKDRGKVGFDELKASEPQKRWVTEHAENSNHDAEAFLDDLKKAPTQRIDAFEVHDEKDHDEDGTADITDEKLDLKSDEIKRQVSTVRSDLRAEADIEKFSPGVQRQIRQQQKEETLKAEARAIIREVGTQKEKAEIEQILKPTRGIDKKLLSDATLREFARREGDSLFGNTYESELRRRQREDAALDVQKIQAAQKKDEKIMMAKERAKERKVKAEKLKDDPIYRAFGV